MHPTFARSTPVASSTLRSSLRSPPSTPTRRIAANAGTLRSAPRSFTPVQSPRTFPTSPRGTELARLGSATLGYLQANQLDYLRAAIEIIVRQVPPVRYYEEVNRLGLDEDLASGLLEAMGSDT